MGGDITVASVIGQGAEFTLLLPRAVPASPAGDSYETNGEATNAASASSPSSPAIVSSQSD